MPKPSSTVVGDTVLRAPGEVLRRSAGDETVLLDMDSEQFYGLNGVGARVFELLEVPHRLDDVIDALHGEYDVDRRILAADIRDLVVELLDKNLLVIET